ncbi:uncharacterized protein LOC114746103 [Neltuma alba]|uniref:uncharacterized protein LOC114746103 n=1 Tax=Neltuma alba TaxID=207710 RepID=UPI0010A4F6EA|nr:uncharacterized protein LOC114746103 [Prosopis alba]
MEFLKDYDFEIKYRLGKANVVVDALSRKAVHVFSQRDDDHLARIQVELENGPVQDYEFGDMGILRYKNRICVPHDEEIKGTILKEANRSHYVIHPSATKMYHDLRQQYWWPNIKKEVTNFVL